MPGAASQKVTFSNSGLLRANVRWVFYFTARVLFAYYRSLEMRDTVVKLYWLEILELLCVCANSKDVISHLGTLVTTPKLRTSVLADVKLQFHGANKSVNIEFRVWSVRLNRCSF